MEKCFTVWISSSLGVSLLLTASVGPSVDDQAVSISDDGTTIIIDFFSSFGPSVDDQAVSLSDDGTTIIIDFFSSFSLLPPFNSSHSPLAF